MRATVNSYEAKVENKKYKNLATIINNTNYKEVLRALIINGIALNEYLVIPCKLETINTANLSEFWHVIKQFDLVRCKSYMIIDKNLKPCAYMITKDSYTKNTEELRMYMLEIVRGTSPLLGTKLLKEMLENHAVIRGYCNDDIMFYLQGVKSDKVELNIEKNYFKLRST